MPRLEGAQYSCDRCGNKEFVPWPPLHEKYEVDRSTQWIRTTMDGKEVWLCPHCAEKYKAMMETFLNPFDPNEV